MAEARTVDGAGRTAGLYARALLPAIPLIGALPGVRHRPGGLPSVVRQRRDVRTDPEHLAAYARVCGFGVGDTLPATYPHLAAFGLQLALMTDTAFPFAPLGTVHVANRITQHRPLRVRDPYDLSVRAVGTRAHPRGTLVDLSSTARVDGETVWEEVTTLLGRGRRRDVDDPLPLRDLTPPTGPTRWQVPADTGRRYAAVSGDRNPIHLYGLTARAFGFPRQLAHGMWTKARCLAALQGRLPDAFTVEVVFRRPVLLPATVAFAADLDGPTTTWAVTAPEGDGVHLLGSLQHT